MLLRKVRYYKFLTGRLMVAQSGTGKTATFSISILQTINTTQRETQALVLSPTRELATQIQSVILALGEYLNVPPQTLSQSLSPHILLSYFPRILSSHTFLAYTHFVRSSATPASAAPTSAKTSANSLTANTSSQALQAA